MSLIVARALPGQIRMVGDTRITDRASIQRGAFVGALRHVIVAPDLCFAFAGNFEKGQECLQKVAALYKNEEPWEEMVEVARVVHEDSGGEAAFLLARLAKGDADLVRVARGEVESDLGFAWIGDDEAYSIYQEARDRTPRDPDGVPNLLKAFAGLLNGTRSASVDAPCLAIATIQGRLAYAPIGVLDPETRRDANGMLKGAAGYAYTIMAPRDSSVGAVAVWFDNRLGALFHPLRKADPLVYRNVSLDDFKRVLQLDFGLVTEEVRFD